MLNFIEDIKSSNNEECLEYLDCILNRLKEIHNKREGIEQ